MVLRCLFLVGFGVGWGVRGCCRLGFVFRSTLHFSVCGWVCMVGVWVGFMSGFCGCDCVGLFCWVVLYVVDCVFLFFV